VCSPDQEFIALGGDKHSSTYFVRVINAFVKNSNGQLWIPRRTAQKKLFPNALDVSVGGYVMTDETYLEAFFLEAREELRLEVEQLPCCEVGYFSPLETGLSAFMRVFEIRFERVPDFNREDFSQGFWLSPAELEVRILAGEKVKDDLLELVRRVYLL
jgi:isopentenyldiphosphate isomerase